MKLSTRLRRTLLLLAAATASTSFATQIHYLQDFGQPNSANNNTSVKLTDYAWKASFGTTNFGDDVSQNNFWHPNGGSSMVRGAIGSPLDAAKVSASGPAQGGAGRGMVLFYNTGFAENHNKLVYTEEHSVAQSSNLLFRWHGAAASTGTNLRLALRVDGSWFVTSNQAQSFTTLTANVADFAQNAAEWIVDPNTAQWLNLSFANGGSQGVLAPGSSATLPAGDITAFGVFATYNPQTDGLGNLAMIDSFTVFEAPEESGAVEYQWSTVRMGGGGTSPGIVAHPLVPGLYFLRTDVGNPYWWHATEQRWVPMLNSIHPYEWWFSAASSLAVDPNDPTGNIVYITAGKYDGRPTHTSRGDIFKTTDRGLTWQRAGLDIHLGANDNQTTGDRLHVDPANSNIVFLITRNQGMFRTASAGAPGTWQQWNNKSGAFLIFDPSGGTLPNPTRTKRIYIHSEGEGILRSEDGGATFQNIGGPANNRVSRAAIGSNGVLFVTNRDERGGNEHLAGVFRYKNGAWSRVAPFKHTAVAVSPHNPDHVIVGRHEWGFNQVFRRSIDGGETWTILDSSNRARDWSEAPWAPTEYFAASTYAFAWDPFNPNRVWFTDWYFAWETQDVFAPTTHWKARAVGHEVMVTVGPLVSPPSGRNLLLSGVADNSGFDHVSLDAPPQFAILGPNRFSGDFPSTGIAISEANPDFIVRVGRKATYVINSEGRSVYQEGWSGMIHGGYSNDGGLTYTVFPTMPSTGAGGRVALSASGDTILWATQEYHNGISTQPGGVFRSTNNGQSWTAVTGVPQSLAGGNIIFLGGHPIAADKVNNNLFYAYRSGSFYRSLDGGASFTLVNSSLPNRANWEILSVTTTPGVTGEVWVSLLTGGLHRSTNQGQSFTKIQAVNRSDLFSIGKVSPNTGNPTLFVQGIVNQKIGVFMSEDYGVTWTELTTPDFQVGAEPNTMAGCRRVFGRVFIGTNGNGIAQGRYVGVAAPTLLASETFNSYPVSTSSGGTIINPLQGNNGGFGFNSPWTLQPGTTGPGRVGEGASGFDGRYATVLSGTFDQYRSLVPVTSGDLWISWKAAYAAPQINNGSGYGILGLMSSSGAELAWLGDTNGGGAVLRSTVAGNTANHFTLTANTVYRFALGVTGIGAGSGQASVSVHTIDANGTVNTLRTVSGLTINDVGRVRLWGGADTQPRFDDIHLGLTQQAVVQAALATP